MEQIVPLVYSKSRRGTVDIYLEKIALIAPSITLLPIDLDTFQHDTEQDIKDNSHILICIEVKDWAIVGNIVISHNLSIGLLPENNTDPFVRYFDLPDYHGPALEMALRENFAKPVDILFCNQKPVLGSVIIGNVPFFGKKRLIEEKDKLWKRFQFMAYNLRQLFRSKLHRVELETAKGNQLSTAMLGIAIIEREKNSPLTRYAKAQGKGSDNQLTAVIISPTSMVAYFKILFTTLFSSAANNSKLPHNIGMLRSTGLKIETDKSIPYWLDGIHYHDKLITLELHSAAINVNAGNDASLLTANTSHTSKETIIVDTLPTDDVRLDRVEKSLTFFAHATENDFRELFLSLKDNALIRGSYISLIILSSILATLGLFLNSAAVVIGAMLLAPLMSPIITISMGILRQDLNLLRVSAKTLIIGTILALSVSALMALLMPYEHLTAEMNGRMQPTILDMLVALVSGVAGAYVTARTQISKSLPGVAIAVALVPPLCVAGVGIGWGQFDVFSGAFLLYITNLAGITFASAVTFMILGYAPFRLARKGLVTALITSLLVAIPLYISFDKIITKFQHEKQLSHQQFIINEKIILLENISLHDRGRKHTLYADIITNKSVSNDDLNKLNQGVAEIIGYEVELDLVIRLRQ